MEQTKHWRLRHWIALGYTVPVSALVISASIAAINISTVNEKAQHLENSRKIAALISELSIDVQIASRTVRGYLLDKNPVSEDSYRTAKSGYEEARTKLGDLIIDKQQKDNFSKLRNLLEPYSAFNDSLINLVNQNKTRTAIKTWKEDSGIQQIENITKSLREMDRRENEIVAEANQGQHEALASLSFTLMLATGLSVFFSTVIAIWLVRRISRQMDESASAIAASTTEIATTIEQQERTANHQAASVNETTTTMDELGASSRQSSEQADAAAAGAQQALVLADNGTKAVERTLDGMGTLRQKVGAIAEQILHLSEQTNQIGSISGLVSDLANQTNMLALNAAVEAVRAGEHGKGFAVVATEIRKLADQSKKSAEKINALVTDIQTAINSTVMVTDEGTKTVEEGVRIAQETSDSFAGVADAVNNVVLNSQQISLNVKQQAIAIQQVVAAMNSLNIAAKETATGIGQIRIGTQRLNESAVKLKTIV